MKKSFIELKQVAVCTNCSTFYYEGYVQDVCENKYCKTGKYIKYLDDKGYAINEDS